MFRVRHQLTQRPDYLRVPRAKPDHQCVLTVVAVDLGISTIAPHPPGADVDHVVIMSENARAGDLPLFVEAKSAGDFTNRNKRRKEEAMKMAQLRNTYGSSARFILFLCGYFHSGYLGYEAAEGIDWVWEHRIDDLALFGV